MATSSVQLIADSASICSVSAIKIILKLNLFEFIEGEVVYWEDSYLNFYPGRWLQVQVTCLLGIFILMAILSNPCLGLQLTRFFLLLVVSTYLFPGLLS